MKLFGYFTYITICSFLLACTSQIGAAPSAPKLLKLEAVSSQVIRIHWKGEPGSGTSVERSTGKQGYFTEVANFIGGKSPYKDSGLSPDSTYCYRARAFTKNVFDVHYSSYTDTICASTSPCDSEECNGSGIPTSKLVSSGNKFYVSPAGSSAGKGTLDDPWDLRTALKHPADVNAGDEIWLREGTYGGLFTSQLAGKAGNPIIVRSYPGEWARLDGGSDYSRGVLTIKNPHVVFMDLEVMRTNFERRYRKKGCTDVHGGIEIVASNVKVINTVVHDSIVGFGVFSNSPDAELYGNLIYYNGLIEVPNNFRRCGHGIYGQNSSGKKVIQDNIVFQNFRTGITPHGSSAAKIDRFVLQGNIVFNNGILAAQPENMVGRNIWFGYSGGKGTPPVIKRPKIIDNYTYNPNTPKGSGSLFLTHSTTGAVVAGNYWIGGVLFRSGKHIDGVFQSNTILAQKYEGNWNPTSEPRNSYYTSKNITAAGNAAIVRRNKYDRDRAHVVIYNYKKLDLVNVDISSLGWNPGDRYELRNAQDLFRDVVQGTYSGDGTIAVPMTGHSVAPPVDWQTPKSTFPEFGAFVLIKQN